MARSRAASGLVFEEPPKARMGPLAVGQRPVWFGRLEPLMEFPGELVRVHKYPSSNTARVAACSLRRNGTHTRRPEGRWEFATRGGFVYARYMGQE